MRIEDNWHLHASQIHWHRSSWLLFVDFKFIFLIFCHGSWRLPIAVSWSATRHQSVIHHFDGFFAFCATLVFACLHVVPPRPKVTRISVIESFILNGRSLGNLSICFERKCMLPSYKYCIKRKKNKHFHLKLESFELWNVSNILLLLKSIYLHIKFNTFITLKL